MPSPPTAVPHYDCYAVTAPGLAPIAAAELRAMGLHPGELEPGGVAFRTDAAGLSRANLWLRTVSRVIVRIAEFRAESFHELERRARTVTWERYVDRGASARFRVTCRKSRLYHSDAVAERLAGAIAVRAGAVGERAGDDDEDVEDPSQLFVVRLFHDRCTVSADSSGVLLHRRGYRQAIARAPLRETLAAAMLLGAEWSPAAPLLDPMAGSGTIAIEAALLARRIAPGLQRRFALERWPDGAGAAMDVERARAHGAVLPHAPARILATDRDAGAVDAARANAERAGVSADLEIDRRALSELEVPDGSGWLVTNPPYGDRVGEREALRSLYARLGQLARERLAGWHVALLSADRRLEGQAGLSFAERFRTSNGGIPVRLLVAQVGDRGRPPAPERRDPSRGTPTS